VNEVIWKYTLSITSGAQRLEMPQGARLLSVAEQAGKLCLWAMVDPAKSHTTRYVEVTGTGQPLDAGINRRLIGTVITDDFTAHHVFER